MRALHFKKKGCVLFQHLEYRIAAGSPKNNILLRNPAKKIEPPVIGNTQVGIHESSNIIVSEWGPAPRFFISVWADTGEFLGAPRQIRQSIFKARGRKPDPAPTLGRYSLVEPGTIGYIIPIK